MNESGIHPKQVDNQPPCDLAAVDLALLPGVCDACVVICKQTTLSAQGWESDDRGWRCQSGHRHGITAYIRLQSSALCRAAECQQAIPVCARDFHCYDQQLTAEAASQWHKSSSALSKPGSSNLTTVSMGEEVGFDLRPTVPEAIHTEPCACVPRVGCEKHYSLSIANIL